MELRPVFTDEGITFVYIKVGWNEMMMGDVMDFFPAFANLSYWSF